MYIRHSVNGIQFHLTIQDRLCVIQANDYTAKSFVLKSMLSAQFNGYSYHYYNWNNYKTVNWYGGPLYDRYSIIVFDDADLYVTQVLSVLETARAIIIVVAKQDNSSLVLRKSRNAVLYELTCKDAVFTMRPKPRTCAYCGRVFGSTQLTVDHMIPKNFCDIYMPGAAIREHYYNKVLVCFDCNRRKSDDIWIPNYSKVKWMRYMTPEQIGGYSKIFVDLLKAQKENVINWIYAKNMQSHVRYKIKYEDARPVIEKEIEFFLYRYLDRSPGDWWELI